MNIRRRAVILSMIISAFLTYAAATNVFASDDVSKNTSPKDPSIKVLMPYYLHVMLMYRQKKKDY